MERLLFAKLELWFVLLLLILVLPGTVLFGFLVLDGAKGAARFGQLSEAAVAVAEIPDTVEAVIHPPDRVRIWASSRFDAISGAWSTPLPEMPKLAGYLLLSRYDGTTRRHKVELISMSDWQTKHTWSPDGAVLLNDAASASRFIDFTTWDTNLFRAIHPLLLPDGDMIVKDHYSPLFRIDACGKRRWLNDDKVFHHSTEADADGNLWIPSLIEPQQLDGVKPEFLEDEIVKVSPDGKILFDRSVDRLMLDHGLDYLLFTNGSYVYDPTHLNDIQPVSFDGPFWKKGDLFLSLRNISTLMLYRPSTDKILWWKQGPWLAQHDVDVLDDHRISVYDNHAEDRGKGAVVLGHSDIIVYDFTTDTISRPYAALMKSEAIQTLFAGLFSALPGGYGLIEDVTNARLVVAGPDGTLAAQYMNRAENGAVYHLGWSRYIDQSLGDKVIAAVQGLACDG